MRFTASLLLTSSLAALGTAKSAFSSFKDPSLQVRQVSPSLTNGERFARGLPPAAPRVSRTGSAKRSGPSGSSTPALLAIELIAIGGSSLGYVWDTTDTNGLFEITRSGDVPLQITLPSAPAPASEGNLLINTNLDGPSEYGLWWFAGVQTTTEPTSILGSGSPAWIAAAAAGYTAPGGSPNSTVGNSYRVGWGNLPSETSIFAVASDGTITTQWVNTDGSTAAVYPFLYEDATLAWSGDIAKFTSTYNAGGKVTPLILRLVPFPQ